MRRWRRHHTTSGDEQLRGELRQLSVDAPALLIRRRAALLLGLVVLLLALAGTGCSSSRLSRRCAKHYPAVVIERRDTVVVTAPSRTDTLTVLTTARDTVVLDTGRVRVMVIRHNDTLRIAAECRSDTIRLPGVIETRVRNIAIEPPWWDSFWVGFSAGALIALLLYLYSRRWA